MTKTLIDELPIDFVIDMILVLKEGQESLERDVKFLKLGVVVLEKRNAKLQNQVNNIGD